MKVAVAIDAVMWRMKTAATSLAILARAGVVFSQVIFTANTTSKRVATARRHMAKMKAVRTNRGRIDRIV